MAMLRGLPIVLCVLALGMPALAAESVSDGGTISIMKPEPAAPAKKNSTKARKARRGSSNPVYPTPLPKPQVPLPVPPHKTVAPHRPQVPPPLYVPQTGRLLPNLPPVTGAGPGGRETFQDRAARCAHQSGVYGPNATGDPGSYIRSCINQ
jgi:hypothetical protein